MVCECIIHCIYCTRSHLGLWSFKLFMLFGLIIASVSLHVLNASMTNKPRGFQTCHYKAFCLNLAYTFRVHVYSCWLGLYFGLILPEIMQIRVSLCMSLFIILHFWCVTILRCLYGFPFDCLCEMAQMLKIHYVMLEKIHGQKTVTIKY